MSADTPELPHDVARATTPRGEVLLRRDPRRRDDAGRPALELRVNGVFVMDTVETSSEQALAAEALTLADAPVRVLVGGLGLGFTAAAVLADPRVARLDVVELEEPVVGWLRDGTVPHGPVLLADPRLHVVVDDVAAVLRAARTGAYDLVLLDVDNGPANLVHTGNAALYETPLLAEVRRALGPGGVAVVWSADHSPALEDALGAVFGAAASRAYEVPGHGRNGVYWLTFARTGVTGP